MSGFRVNIIAVVFLSLLLFAAGCKKDSSMQIGLEAPEISVLDLNDRTVKLSDFRGKVVVLRFWTSGCKSCVTEMPVLDGLYKKYKDKGMEILAINMGDSKKSVEKFVADMKISYPALLDPISIAAQKYGVKAAPTTFFIDRKGMAKRVFYGMITNEEFEKTVNELL